MWVGIGVTIRGWLGGDGAAAEGTCIVSHTGQNVRLSAAQSVSGALDTAAACALLMADKPVSWAGVAKRLV